MLDPLMMAELLLAVLIVATLDRQTQPSNGSAEHEQAPAPQGWSALTDPHAQRILRLEQRRAVPAARP